jgi:hypothetical protein
MTGVITRVGLSPIVDNRPMVSALFYPSRFARM